MREREEYRNFVATNDRSSCRFLFFFFANFPKGGGGDHKESEKYPVRRYPRSRIAEASCCAASCPFSAPSRWPRGNNGTDQSFISYRTSSSMWKCDHLEAASKYNSAETSLVGVPVRCVRVRANRSYIFYYWPMEPVPGGGTGARLVGGFDS